jgi:hypothetical protein
MNKKLFFYSIIVFSLQINAMMLQKNELSTPSIKQKLDLFTHHTITFNNGLNDNLNKSILNYTITPYSKKELPIIAKTISSLIQTNKQLNSIIDDRIFCLILIKELAYKCNCFDESIIQIFQTQRGIERNLIQKKLKHLCVFQFIKFKEY